MKLKGPLVVPGFVSPKIAAAKRNGSRGARARLANTTFEQRQAWGEAAGAAVLTRYGHGYFKYLRSCVRPGPRKRKKVD